MPQHLRAGSPSAWDEVEECTLLLPISVFIQASWCSGILDLSLRGLPGSLRHRRGLQAHALAGERGRSQCEWCPDVSRGRIRRIESTWRWQLFCDIGETACAGTGTTTDGGFDPHEILLLIPVLHDPTVVRAAQLSCEQTTFHFASNIASEGPSFPDLHMGCTAS